MTNLATFPDDLPQKALAHTRRGLPKYAKDVDRPYEGDPWARQPKESAKAHSAFLIYLRMEDRTLAAADRAYNVANGRPNSRNAQSAQWATKHRWSERALAYDNYITSIEVAAHKRQLVRSATRHAKQAAEIQEVLMLPMNELRKRIEEQGGEFEAVASLSDDSLMKLARSFAADVPIHQKSEREALTSTSATVVPRTEVKAKGEIVRQLLMADPSVRALMEKVTFTVETTEPLESESE